MFVPPPPPAGEIEESRGNVMDPVWVVNCAIPWLEGRITALEDGEAGGFMQAKDLQQFKKGLMDKLTLALKELEPGNSGGFFEKDGQRIAIEWIESIPAWLVAVGEQGDDAKVLEKYFQIVGLGGYNENGSEVIKRALGWCSALRDRAANHKACVHRLLELAERANKDVWNTADMRNIAFIAGRDVHERVYVACGLIREADARPLAWLAAGRGGAADDEDDGLVELLRDCPDLVFVEKRAGLWRLCSARLAKAFSLVENKKIELEVFSNIYLAAKFCNEAQHTDKDIVVFCAPEVAFNATLICTALGPSMLQKSIDYEIKIKQVVRSSDDIKKGAHVLILTGDMANLDQVLGMFKTAGKVTLVGGALEGVEGADGGNLMCALGARSNMPPCNPNFVGEEQTLDGVVQKTGGGRWGDSGGPRVYYVLNNTAITSREIVREGLGVCASGRKTMGVVGPELLAVVQDELSTAKKEFTVAVFKDPDDTRTAGRVDMCAIGKTRCSESATISELARVHGVMAHLNRGRSVGF